MSELEELSKEFIEKFFDTPVIKRRCMCCGKEFSTLGSSYVCSDCQLAQQRQEEEIHKRLKAAYDDGYIAGAKATMTYITDKIQELLVQPFIGKTEKQLYQRKGMEEGLKIAIEFAKELITKEVD
jgi:threonine synthase